MKFEALLYRTEEEKRGCAKRKKFRLNTYLVEEDGYHTKSLKPLKKREEYGCKHSVVSPYNAAEVHSAGTVVGDRLSIDYSIKGATVNHPIPQLS